MKIKYYHFFIYGGLRRNRFMKRYAVNEFNQVMRARTRKFAVEVFNAVGVLKLNEISRIPAKQLIRSASSVASNYYSATRGRSLAEYYAKICIVVEESDETIFWIDFLVETGVLKLEQVKEIEAEANEFLRIFSTIKKKLKTKRYNN